MMRTLQLAAVAMLLAAAPAFAQTAQAPKLSGEQLQKARTSQCTSRYPEYQREHPGANRRAFLRRCLSGAFDRYGTRQR